VPGRSQAWDWGLKPPPRNKNIAPSPNEMKPIIYIMTKVNGLHFVWGNIFVLGGLSPAPKPMAGYVPAQSAKYTLI